MLTDWARGALEFVHDGDVIATQGPGVTTVHRHNAVGVARSAVAGSPDPAISGTGNGRTTAETSDVGSFLTFLARQFAEKVARSVGDFAATQARNVVPGTTTVAAAVAKTAVAAGTAAVIAGSCTWLVVYTFCDGQPTTNCWLLPGCMDGTINPSVHPGETRFLLTAEEKLYGRCIVYCFRNREDMESGNNKFPGITSRIIWELESPPASSATSKQAEPTLRRCVEIAKHGPARPHGTIRHALNKFCELARVRPQS